MPSVDFDDLTRPLSDTLPCGLDLDAEGDVDFLSFFASAESVLPQSYFRTRNPETGEQRLFDPKMIAFEEYFARARPLVEKTHDIRLTVLLAKLSILNRDISGFVTCLKALVELLVQHWDQVHPRGEGEDFSYRGVALEALDVTPTVTMPLQFLPLVEDRRIGAVSYRNYLTATGAVVPAEGEMTLDLDSLGRVLDTCDLALLTEMHRHFEEILDSTKQLRDIWSEKTSSGESLSFEQLRAEAGAIAKWLGDTIKRRSPEFASGQAQSSPDTGAHELAEIPAGASHTGAVRSIAQATVALNTVARYYAAFEPSSPARLLINLSEQVIGKNFAEVLQILTPGHLDQAALKVGTRAVVDLPIARIGSGLVPLEGLPDSEPATEFTVSNRAQAIEIVDQVSSFFRIAEPSSPIPMLLERIRDLSNRDFFSLLNSVLPADALKPPD